MTEPADPGEATAQGAYTQRLLRKEAAWWKRMVDVRAVYGRNLRRLNPGFTLDVGCGLGRNLLHLHSRGVGVDHNRESVAVCRSRGLVAFTAEEFGDTPLAVPGRFDSLLLSHIVEHMPFEQAAELLARYLPLIDPAHGQVIVIAPQELGYRSDPTHVEFMDQATLARLLRSASLTVVRSFSFPLPHVPFGRLFRYNEFVVVGRKEARPLTSG